MPLDDDRVMHQGGIIACENLEAESRSEGEHYEERLRPQSLGQEGFNP